MRTPRMLPPPPSPPPPPPLSSLTTPPLPLPLPLPPGPLLPAVGRVAKTRELAAFFVVYAR
jgi:hypothetical protein